MFPEKSQSGYILSSSYDDADDGTDLWKTPFALGWLRLRQQQGVSNADLLGIKSRDRNCG